MINKEYILYADFSDVEDCKGFTNVYYFMHCVDFLATQSGYTTIKIKRDSRIIQHTENIKKYLFFNCHIEFCDNLEFNNMIPFSTVKRARRLRNAGIDVVFKLQTVAKFRRYGMIGFGGYPDSYIKSMKFNNVDVFKKFIEKEYTLIHRSIIINIRRGDKLDRKWRTCWNGRGRGFLIVDSKSVRNIIINNKSKPIIFVSDDINWCKKHFSNYKNVKFFDISYDNNKVMTDLVALSMCMQIYGDNDCTFTQLGVILNNNSNNKKHDYPHYFFVREKISDGFYEHRKTREKRMYVDFRARQYMFNCKPIEMNESFNYWYYINQILIFLKDKMYMRFIKL